MSVWCHLHASMPLAMFDSLFLFVFVAQSIPLSMELINFRNMMYSYNVVECTLYFIYLNFYKCLLMFLFVFLFLRR